MKVSIITPSFNGARFLRDCLESVRIQTGVECEHIVQDAGSTDGSLEILADYPEVLLYREPDLGMSDAINKGLKHATGDWWMWLNTDDLLLPDALATVSSFAAAHPEADVIYGDWLFVDARRQHLKKCSPPAFNRFVMAHAGCYIASTATFFKKKTTFDAGELLCVPFKQAMDQEYFVRLGQLKKKFLHVPSCLAEFRIHGNNTSTRYSGKQDVTTTLQRQIQLAEGATVRRVYGFSLSRRRFEIANNLSDFVLYLLCFGWKVIRKLIEGCYWR